MKKMIRNALCGAFAAALSLCAAVPASAADLGQFDAGQPCRLTLQLKTENTELSPAGTEAALYRAADIAFSDGEAVFTYTDAFAECTVNLTDVMDAAAAQAVWSYARSNQIAETAKKTADDSGEIVFDALPCGLYLVGGIKSAEGFSDLLPFFVTLPYADENYWSYDVTAEPKLSALSHESVRVRVKKVWDGDEGSHPEKITVELLDSLGVHDTVELSEKNQWSYEWNDLSDDMKWNVREKEIPAGYSVSYTADGYSFTITNTKTAPPSGGGKKLWQTGQRNWPIPILAGGGMLLILAGLMIRRGGQNSRRKQHEGEAENV